MIDCSPFDLSSVSLLSFFNVFIASLFSILQSFKISRHFLVL